MKGFWSDRPPAGQADARLLAAEKMHKLRHTSFPELLGRAESPTRWPARETTRGANASAAT
jgi:hypothetical protein